MGREFTSTGEKITDSAGAAVIDSSGLVGATSFISSISESTANQDIVGGTYLDITKLGGTVTTTRTTPVLFFTRAEFIAEGTINAYFRLNINSGTTIYPNQANSPGWIQYYPVADEPMGFSISYLVDIPTGTNIVKLQAKTSVAGGTITITEYSHFGYTVLGK